jgi:hypothetical protein
MAGILVATRGVALRGLTMANKPPCDRLEVVREARRPPPLDRIPIREIMAEIPTVRVGLDVSDRANINTSGTTMRKSRVRPLFEPDATKTEKLLSRSNSQAVTKKRIAPP